MRNGFDFLQYLLSLIVFDPRRCSTRDTAHANLEDAYPAELAASKTRMEACV